MYYFRDKKTDGNRVMRPLMEIVATHEHLPLQEENWAERWCTLPKDFEDVFESMYNLEVRDDDVFVVTYIKCGTTWMQETAWLLLNNLDYQRAKNEDLIYRSVFLDFSGTAKEMPINSIDMCNKQQGTRLIKSHLPVNLLPKQLWQKKSKVIYVARNIKDVVVSSYHFVKGLSTWRGDINEFVQDFMNNDIMYTPYLAHLVDFWKLRHEPHIFFTTYEEMTRDLAGVAQKLCVFLERPQLMENEMKPFLEHLSFDKMRDNKKTDLAHNLRELMPIGVSEDFQFMRRGIVGSYKDELTAEMQCKLEEWYNSFLAKHNIKAEDIFGNI